MTKLLRQAPNMLSALRLVAAPFTAFLILGHSYGAAFCMFIFAGLSDALDGFLAKRFSMTSQFGAWLDPAADKFLMLASFVTLTMVGAVPLWLTALVIGRDAAIVLGVGLARALNAPLQIRPLIVGKASTVAQVMYIALVLLLLAANLSEPRVIFAGAVIVGAFTLWSFLSYAAVWLAAVAPGRRAA